MNVVAAHITAAADVGAKEFLAPALGNISREASGNIVT